MKEKEIRSRIEQFLRVAARKVVVPASVGLATASGCEALALRSGEPDAARDAAALASDTARAISDTLASGPDTRDASSDLPQMMVPYLTVLVGPDVGPDQSSDSESGDGVQGPVDARTDVADAYIMYPPPPYLLVQSPTVRTKK